MMELPVVIYFTVYNILGHCYRNKGLSLAIIKKLSKDMYLSFLSLSPLQIRTRTRSSYTTNSGMIRNFAFYMVRNSGRQLPRNKIIWLDARIIFKLNRLQSAFIITLIVMTNKKQLNKKLNNQLVKK